MSRNRYYTFTLPDGEVKVMTLAEAHKIDDVAIKARIQEIIQNSKVKRMNKDGFEPGWQENIREYVGGRREYDKRVKELGLQEIGYDYMIKESNPDIHPCANEWFVDTAKEVGIQLNDQEVDAIKSGEYFKDDNFIKAGSDE